MSVGKGQVFLVFEEEKLIDCLEKGPPVSNVNASNRAMPTQFDTATNSLCKVSTCGIIGAIPSLMMT